MHIKKSIKHLKYISEIRSEAERIDPGADWGNAGHLFTSENGLTERQNKAIRQARLNIKARET